MEIIFDNVTIIKNKNTVFQKTILNNFNMKILDNKITGICGSFGKSTIGKLIATLETVDTGIIKIDDFSLSRKKYIPNINNLRSKIGYIGDQNDFLFKKSVKDEISLALKTYNYKLEKLDKHVLDALKMVGLEEECLLQNPNHLSFSEKKKVQLATVLAYNPQILILDDFEKGLNKHDKKNIKILLKTLRNRFNKTIIVITNDITFMFDLCNCIHVLDNGEIILSGEKEVFYDDKLYRIIEISKIIEFVKYVKSLNHNILECTDIKELIKAVYRDVQ